MHASIPQLLALASRHLEQGAPAQAEALFRQILAVRPEEPNALYGLAVVAMMAGAHADAARLLRAALKKVPRAAHWWFVLGEALRQLGDTAEAAQAYGKATRLDPSNATAWNNLGAACQALERHEDAVRAFRRAVDLRPDQPEYHANLGAALQKLERNDEAGEILARAVRLDPDYGPAWLNLGNVHLVKGEFDSAVDCFLRAQRAMPQRWETLDNLAVALARAGKRAEAIALLKEAIPDRATALTYRELSRQLLADRQFTEAERYARLGLEHFPDHPSLLTALGEALTGAGEVESGLAVYAEAELRGADAQAGGRAFLLNARSQDAAELRAAAEAAARSLCPRKPKAPRPRPRRPGERLRVGYVSADFRRHSVAYFLEGLLRAHDRGRVEITCLAANETSDEMTRVFQELAHHWVPIADRNATQVAQTIRRAQLDILVDLSGYTSGTRLDVFALHPAPVQVTYMGYPGSTGLPTIGWRLTDALADPPGLTDAAFTETLVRLPRCFLAYTPYPGAPEPGPLPASRRGHITFGSFNVLHKLSDQTLRLWGRVLAAVPDSRLFLKTSGFSDPGVRQRWMDRFAAHGIAAERIQLAPWAPDTASHLGLYHEIDLALDTFPYHGTTTTCEALWMGVPVVTLAGRTHAARVGVSLLSAVGLPELIARSEDEYVAIAAALAQDRARLAGLRSTLRARMAASPLCDAQGLARAIEAAYEAMVEEAVRRR